MRISLRHKKADPRTYMREYMQEYRARNKPSLPAPSKRDSQAIIRRILDDESLMEQLRILPRQAAYNHLFVRLNLELHEAEAILKECFP